MKVHPSKEVPPVLQAKGPFLRFIQYDASVTQLSVLYIKAAKTGGDGSKDAPALLLRRRCDAKDVQQRVEAELLEVCHNASAAWCFYRYHLSLECSTEPCVYVYHVEDPDNPSREYTIHLPTPGGGPALHWGFYSCNGLHDKKKAKKYNGTKPLWNDVMRRHREEPFHFLIGGGDQIYCDEIWHGPELQKWVKLLASDRQKGLQHPFTEKMEKQVHNAYLNLHLQHWGSAWAEALGCIPQIMTWDDHDIFDGWGSHERSLQTCPVFQGIYTTARKFYALFQHHTTVEQGRSRLFGAEGSWHWLQPVSPSTAVLALDTRGERTRQRIICQESWHMIRTKLEQLPEGIRYLVVVSAVPFVFPEISGALEASKCVTACVKPCGGLIHDVHQHGLGEEAFSAFGEVEVLDDLLDSWNADVHQDEKRMAIKMFQEIAQQKNVRVLFVSGDVHQCGVGSFFSKGNELPADKDFRYMPSVTSSAIGNVPPPSFVHRATNQNAPGAKVLDEHTLQQMHAMFGGEYTYVKAARNWCEAQTKQDSVCFKLRCELKKGDIKGNTEVFSLSVPCLQSEDSQVFMF